MVVLFYLLQVFLATDFEINPFDGQRVGHRKNIRFTRQVVAWRVRLQKGLSVVGDEKQQKKNQNSVGELCRACMHSK